MAEAVEVRGGVLFDVAASRAAGALRAWRRSGADVSAGEPAARRPASVATLEEAATFV